MSEGLTAEMWANIPNALNPHRRNDGFWLDPADAELCEPSGLIPAEAPTTRDVSGPRDGGRKS